MTPEEAPPRNLKQAAELHFGKPMAELLEQWRWVDRLTIIEIAAFCTARMGRPVGRGTVETWIAQEGASIAELKQRRRALPAAT